MEIRLGRGQKVPVGAVEYTTICTDKDDAEHRDEKWFGSTNKRTLEIIVRGDLAPDRAAETAVHEIAHAVNNEYCNSSLCEDQVAGMGMGFAQVLKAWGVTIVVEKE